MNKRRPSKNQRVLGLLSKTKKTGQIIRDLLGEDAWKEAGLQPSKKEDYRAPTFLRKGPNAKNVVNRGCNGWD